MKTNAAGKRIISKYALDGDLPVSDAENLVDNYVLVPLLSNQHAAVVSFATSITPYDFYRSKLLKHINERDFLSASREFELWVMRGGKQNTQLVKRRKKEHDLFLRPEIVSGG